MQFHDQLSNELPTLKGKWGFTFKVFRNNPYAIPPELAGSHTSSPHTKFLYTLTPSYLQDACITLINRKSAAVFCGTIDEETDDAARITIPSAHLHGGATSGLNDPFDYLVGQRLQSLWTQRQAIKGDGGNSYELENGRLVVRTSNVFLHGNFRGLLIQIEVDAASVDASADLKQVFAAVMAKYNIPQGHLCCDVLDRDLLDAHGDLALQYAEILNF